MSRMPIILKWFRFNSPNYYAKRCRLLNSVQIDNILNIFYDNQYDKDIKKNDMTKNYHPEEIASMRSISAYMKETKHKFMHDRKTYLTTLIVTMTHFFMY